MGEKKKNTIREEKEKKKNSWGSHGTTTITGSDRPMRTRKKRKRSADAHDIKKKNGTKWKERKKKKEIKQN